VGDTPYFLEWNILVDTAKDGSTILTEDKLEVVHRAVLKKCDALDGLADGLLMNPARCEFDPRSIVRKGGQDAAQCLTADQADVVQKFRDRARACASVRPSPPHAVMQPCVTGMSLTRPPARPHLA
jgi:Tannase and feruloyl esterase